MKRRVLVTGATSGIGKACTILLTQRGYDVIATGRNASVLADIADSGHAVATVAADLAETQAAKFIYAEACKGGPISGLVHSAGVISAGGMDDESDEGFNSMMTINVHASFRILKACWEDLKQTKGSAVLVSSLTGLRASPDLLTYCVSKAAVDHLVRCAALDGAPFGVRVNGVNPGVVVTELHKRGGMDEERYAAFLEHSKDTHPLGRPGQPEEIAEAIEWLISDKAEWITGVNLPTDGGRQLTCLR
ncbi:cyclopentanol dehydrogenase [bacterium BMS3Bbin04]|nr:cyclopentanol dehydrogenase [bacterium BMS3Bbin04]